MHIHLQLLADDLFPPLVLCFEGGEFKWLLSSLRALYDGGASGERNEGKAQE